MAYEFTDSLYVRVANINSFALRKVATPGNALSYGIEFNGELGYRSGGFAASLAYGLLFPLDAMNHPEDNPDDGGPGFGYGAGNTGDAGNAHNIQLRAVLTF
jgi:hypothetical protein